MGDATLTTYGPAVPDEPQADGSIDTLTGGPGADTFIENYYVDIDVENPYAIDNLLVEQDDVVDAMRIDTVLDQEVPMPVWGLDATPVLRSGREQDGESDTRSSLSTKG